VPSEPAGAEQWALWTLRALLPEADPAALQALRERQRRLRDLEETAMRRLAAGDRRLLEPGRRLLDEAPELRSGLILTIHSGPYQLALEPFLAAGLPLTVLLNEAARRALAPRAAAMSARLGHAGRVTWASLGDRDCARLVIAAIRRGEPVLAFADGNQGEDGFAGTRAHGTPYQLPGREIRLRPGLARLACRLECAVHPLAARWTPEGGVTWRRAATQHWCRQDDPRLVAVLIMDWVVAEITSAPEQWTYWTMVAETSSAFASSEPTPAVPEALHDDYRRAFAACLARAATTVHVELGHELEVWPGDVLVDHTGDRFYAAEGLAEPDLAPLRGEAPTLAALVGLRGEAWVNTHVLRLCLLGLARLGWGPASA
jgi:lauroyl/myristoyl acyltransferase